MPAVTPLVGPLPGFGPVLAHVPPVPDLEEVPEATWEDFILVASDVKGQMDADADDPLADDDEHVEDLVVDQREQDDDDILFH